MKFCLLSTSHSSSITTMFMNPTSTVNINCVVNPFQKRRICAKSKALHNIRIKLLCFGIEYILGKPLHSSKMSIHECMDHNFGEKTNDD